LACQHQGAPAFVKHSFGDKGMPKLLHSLEGHRSYEQLNSSL